jgi:Thioesterase-like superfamily
VTDPYFVTRDGSWFSPTDLCRGPWDVDACHAGPPTGLMVRALEHLVPNGLLSRLTVELTRPVPMSGFMVQAEVRRPGRSVMTTEAEIFDEDHVYARATGLHLRRLAEPLPCRTADVDVPDFARAVPGPFPIRSTRHDLPAFNTSVEVRYDPAGSQGVGGPTTIWMKVPPLLADEEPTGLQRLCPLADSGNGISYNDYLDRVLFLNADLTVAIHRQPVGEWFCSRVASHWESTGVGLADAELFDLDGHVGRALQTLLLQPAS